MHAQSIMKALLILQFSALKSTVVLYNSWHTGAGADEQARRVTAWRSKMRWEMTELKDCRQ